jgi:hypothetical protein
LQLARFLASRDRTPGVNLSHLEFAGGDLKARQEVEPPADEWCPQFLLEADGTL